ncbi:MAG: hypothetical protein H7X80_08060, partial [bacterium]|nr:hypothetical protein [Candidatus Kapabacteria bacterium]
GALDFDILSSRSNDASAVGVRVCAEELIVFMGHGFEYGAAVRYSDGSEMLRVDLLAGMTRGSRDYAEWVPWVSAELRLALIQHAFGLMFRGHYRPNTDASFAFGFVGAGLYFGWDVAE